MINSISHYTNPCYQELTEITRTHSTSKLTLGDFKPVRNSSQTMQTNDHNAGLCQEIKEGWQEKTFTQKILVAAIGAVPFVTGAIGTGLGAAYDYNEHSKANYGPTIGMAAGYTVGMVGSLGAYLLHQFKCYQGADAKEFNDVESQRLLETSEMVSEDETAV